MKKIFLIILLLLIFSSLYGKKNWEYFYSENCLNFKTNNHLILVFELTTSTNLGINFIWSRAGKTGFFGTVYTKLFGPVEDEIYDNISIYMAEEVFGDWYRGDSFSNALYAGGITYGLSKSTLICVGLGIASQTKYRNYYDHTHILGDDGSYYIVDEKKWGIGFYLQFLFKVARTFGLTLSSSFYPFQVGFGAGFDFGL